MVRADERQTEEGILGEGLAKLQRSTMVGELASQCFQSVLHPGGMGSGGGVRLVAGDTASESCVVLELPITTPPESA